MQTASHIGDQFGTDSEGEPAAKVPQQPGASTFAGGEFSTEDEGPENTCPKACPQLRDCFGTDDEEEATGMATCAAKPPARRRPEKPSAAVLSHRARSSASLKRSDCFETDDEEEATGSATCAAKPPRKLRKKPATSAKAATQSGPKEHQKVISAKGPEPTEDLPTSSGAFAYARWAGHKKLTPAELGVLSQKVSVGSVCSGMSTETLALEAIRRVHPQFNYDVKLVCESAPAKLKFLRAKHPGAVHVEDIQTLAKSPQIKSADGKVYDRPVVDILFAGISCKGVSGLNVSPESVLGKGSTGNTLRGLRDFIEALPHEERPQLLFLENVACLDHQRAAEGYRLGTMLIADIFDNLGYVGDWSTVNAKDFFLPQSRDRVWMLFWKRPSHSGDQEFHEDCAAKLRGAMALVQRLTVSPHEPLSAVLDRLGQKAFVAKRSRLHEPISVPTAAKHKAFAVKHGLEAAAADVDSFKQLIRTTWSPRASDAAFLKLMEARKKHGWAWQSDTLVLSVGQSVEFMQCCRECFPTLTPMGDFLVLRAGSPFRPSGRLALAVQGVQDDEALFMGLDKLSGALQQDLAGNAFSANVCIAFLFAGLVTLVPTKSTHDC